MGNCHDGFSDYEKGILKKYREGRVISPGDKDIVNELAYAGLMHIGFSLSEKKDTASTTYAGKLIVWEKNSIDKPD